MAQQGINALRRGESRRAKNHGFSQAHWLRPLDDPVSRHAHVFRPPSPTTRAQFEASCGPSGHLLIGNPEQVAEKIVGLHQVFANTRILIQMAIGAMPHKAVLTAIELLGTKVAPLVRKELS